MAKRTEEAEVIVTVKGESAKNYLQDLKNKVSDLTKKMDEAYRTGQTKLGDSLSREINKLKKEVSSVTTQTKTFKDIIENLNDSSIKELTKAQKHLQAIIKSSNPNTAEWRQASEQYRQVTTRINSLNSAYRQLGVEVNTNKITLKGFVEGFTKYFGAISVALAGITGISVTLRKCSELVAQLDDTYADVMKTTSLTRDQVVDLNSEFKKMDTRTSREALNNLARDAGKLGIKGKENILEFVRAADQINVALGEDLGEGAIKNLGKIADVFGLTQLLGIEKSLLSIGSAINALGQDSNAAEAYLVEFTQRLAGVGAQTNLSVQSILGYASGLDQSAMKVEMAATAFQKFLMNMYSDTATYAEYAGMQVEEFSELLKNDANTAIMTVLTSLRDQGGFEKLVPIFKDMDVEGSRAVSVLSSMASNLQAVKKAQSLANVEFAKATSLSDEFTVKNNNLMAELEKARKEFNDAKITLGEKLNPVLLKSTKLSTNLIKVIASSTPELVITGTAVLALAAAVKIKTAAVAGSSVVMSTWKTIANVCRTAFFLLTGQIKMVTKAWKDMNVAAKTSVFGLAITVITTLVFWVVELIRKRKELNEVESKAKAIEDKVVENYKEEEARIRTLVKIVNDQNISLENRKKCLLELKEIVPDYHASLTEEGTLINNNAAALQNYIDKLKQRTRMDIFTSEFKSLETQLVDIEAKIEDAKQVKQAALVKQGNEEIREFVIYRDRLTAEMKKSYTNNLTEYGKAVKNLEELEESRNQILRDQEFIISVIGEVSMSAKEKEIKAVIDEYNNARSYALKNIDNQEELKNEIIRIENEKVVALATIAKKYQDAVPEALRKIEFSLDIKDFDINKFDNYKDAKTALDKIFTTQENEIKQKFANKEINEKSYNKQIEQNEINHYNALYQLSKSFHENEEDALGKYLDVMIKYNEKLSKELKKINNDLYEKEKNAAENAYKKEQLQIIKDYANGVIETQEDFEAKKEKSTNEYNANQLVILKKYGKDTTETETKIYNQQIKDNQLKLQLKQKQLEKHLQIVKKFRKELSVQQQYETDLGELMTVKDAVDENNQRLMTEEEYQQALLNLRKKYAKLATEEIEKNDDLGIWEKYKLEKEALDKYFSDGKTSWEDYEKEVKKLRIKYAQETMQLISNTLSQVNNLISTLRDFELAQAESQYQADLTAAGDDAAAREQIEQDYQQKQLDIKKKYADADMAIQILQATASSALAVMQAWSAAGGHPVLFAVYAALIGATLAATIASIVAQRNALMNTSVSPSGSSGSSGGSNYGERTVTPGMKEGGYAAASSDDNTPAGIYHANEYIAPAWMVRDNPILFANIEKYRQSGTKPQSLQNTGGMKEGGYASQQPDSAQNIQLSKNDINKLTKAIDKLSSDGVQSYLVYNQYQDFMNQRNRYKLITGKK